MEQLSIAPTVMRQRVEEILDLLGLAELRTRALATLSGGQQQRVAIGSVLTAHPKVLVLDEPTSALDPMAAEDVLAAITRIVHDLGVTVVLAEHRLERVVQYADRIVYLAGDGTVTEGLPEPQLAGDAGHAVAPPIVELGRLARWSPLPLSVRDARRTAAPAAAVVTRPACATGPSTVVVEPADRARRARGRRPLRRGHRGGRRRPDPAGRRGHRVDGAQRIGQVVAAVGPAGQRAAAGRSDHGGRAGRPGAADARRPALPRQRRGRTARPTISPGRCSTASPRASTDDTHPRDLSEGQRLALVLALQLGSAPTVVLLDEPTRGLDYDGKRALIRIVNDLTSDGRAVLIATHDVEFVAGAADRVIVHGRR